MGTRGYRAYRHKGYYHVHYNHYDSYPDGLGVQVAAEIPRDPEAYKRWLDVLRENLDQDYENNKDAVDSDGDGDYFITKTQPTNDIMIEWVYEIDLDHEVFLVDANPLFALNNMPTSEGFLEGIGVDSYGHRSYDPSTPEQHIYNWKSQPPTVDDRVIDDYVARQSNSECDLSMSELLGTKGLVGSCETARLALYELIISRVMMRWEIGHEIRVLETVSDRSEIDPFLFSVGLSIVQVTIGPMLFGPKAQDTPSLPEDSEFSWLAPNILLRITTHLDDERNLKKNILELVDEVVTNRQPGCVTFGILFSFFHCVIVRVDPQNGFTSTATLQFLPSFYANSPSTPGIAAIGSLAYHCLDTPKGSTFHKDHFLHQIPLDILEIIVGYLGPSDLLNLCAAAPGFAPAVEDVLRFPHIEDYRLVGVVEDGKKEPSLKSKAFCTQVQHSMGPVMIVGGKGTSEFVGGKGTNSFGFSIGGRDHRLAWKLEAEK
ncbi:hypothetical protein DFH06DRAFT_1050533 [Mycena polygramma]|nr:hypothetical protein DFH06DRAFT_1050533 [Mycena polygramma]